MLATLGRTGGRHWRSSALWAMDNLVRAVTGAPRRRWSQVTPDILVGGQYRRRGWRRLAAAGVTGVVNMRMEYCDREAGIAPMRYLHLPTVDFHAPTLEQLQRGVAFIEEELAGGGRVYVHCRAGMGRAVTMVAAYLVSTGLVPAEAWARIRAVRPFIAPTRRQRAIVDEWAAILDRERT